MSIKLMSDKELEKKAEFLGVRTKSLTREGIYEAVIDALEEQLKK